MVESKGGSSVEIQKGYLAFFAKGKSEVGLRFNTDEGRSGYELIVTTIFESEEMAMRYWLMGKSDQFSSESMIEVDDLAKEEIKTYSLPPFVGWLMMKVIRGS